VGALVGLCEGATVGASVGGPVVGAAVGAPTQSVLLHRNPGGQKGGLPVQSSRGIGGIVCIQMYDILHTFVVLQKAGIVVLGSHVT
jgi:hypothetical protein